MEKIEKMETKPITLEKLVNILVEREIVTIEEFLNMKDFQQKFILEALYRELKEENEQL